MLVMAIAMAVAVAMAVAMALILALALPQESGPASSAAPTPESISSLARRRPTHRTQQKGGSSRNRPFCHQTIEPT